ncbi:sensor histidine kinase [Candidatus Clostridium radicumherbarum]|uniref:histidine kinase n=1 Tax=Candidatus Clostridium radicumherbarum TaxID=3381662 RepID=A0ABW8TT08_9CLOT
MRKEDFNIETINKITKKIIGEIGSSRELIVEISESLRKEYEKLKCELSEVKNRMVTVIHEVDSLEKDDKAMRQKLAEVSANFDKYTELDIKFAYEEASEVRIQYFGKQNEEKNLRDKRTSLEIALRQSLKNINQAEKVVNQVSIALGYLEGDLLPVIESSDKSSEMYMGIKILEAQENERKRIAKDIHDGPAQHMANVVMKVDICEKFIKKDVEKALTELSDLKEAVKIALKEVRSIIYDLRPMLLEEVGLNQTINDTVHTILKDTNIEVEFTLKPVKKEIEPIIQVAVYRILQEVFNNIKKHSNAKHTKVKLDFGTKYLMLIISDDGKGFDVKDTLKKVRSNAESFGLIGIYDRVHQLQGELKIKSSIGSGTTYIVKLPINREVIKDDRNGD